MLRTTSICDRSALTARVERPSADYASQLWALVLCHTVRANVRGTVRDTADGQRERSEGRCTIRGACPHSWKPGLHQLTVGSHKLPVFPESTYLRPSRSPVPTPADLGLARGPCQTSDLVHD